MTTDKLKKILESHKAWLACDGGKRANLTNTDLRGADLRGAVLERADLREADLEGADLENTDLRGADLRGAVLERADLSYSSLKGASLKGACLRGARLQWVNLQGTDLTRADLQGADLSHIIYDEYTTFYALQCPEEGAFIGWKKCLNGVIVKLLIPEDAKRSSATSRKCRASKAIVLEIIGAKQGISTVDTNFIYEVGKEAIPDSFDDDRWRECSHGIHFFITKAEAEKY